jgi:hypothetical protein
LVFTLSLKLAPMEFIIPEQKNAFSGMEFPQITAQAGLMTPIVQAAEMMESMIDVQQPAAERFYFACITAASWTDRRI